MSEPFGAGMLRALADVAADNETLGARTTRMLRAAAAELAVAPAGLAELERVLGVMSASWSPRRLGDAPAWSGLTRDRSPLEFSANFDREGVELRFALEAHGAESSPASYWQAANDLVDRLCRDHAADRTVFDRIADLYVPSSNAVYMAAAFATGIGRSGRPSFKLYLPLEASGLGNERALMAATFSRLGLDSAWTALEQVTGTAAQWSLLAIDMKPGAPSFKIYERLMGWDPGGLAKRVAHGAETSSDLIARFSEAMDLGPALVWSVLTYAFRADACSRTTYHVPISPLDDETRIRALVRQTFDALDVPRAAYERLLTRAAADATPLFHTYVSCQSVDAAARLTTYLSPRLYQARYGVTELPGW